MHVPALLRTSPRFDLIVLIVVSTLAVSLLWRDAAHAANACPAPQPGGLTECVAGTTEPGLLMDAQAFNVRRMWLHDATDGLLVYTLGDEAGQNGAFTAALTAETLVVMGRAGGSETPNLFVNDLGDASDADPGDGWCATMALGAGVCTLRAAIQEANAHAGVDTIGFAFAVDAGGISIAPGSALPGFVDQAVIDGGVELRPFGVSQGPLVELTGVSAGAGAFGLAASGVPITVRSLVVNGFDGTGIILEKADGSVVEGSYIGTNLAGTVAMPNGQQGVLLRDTAGARIGGTASTQRNVISGNAGEGLQIVGVSPTAASQGNAVHGNYIGLDVTGISGLANGLSGVYIQWGQSNHIGGTAAGEGNVISGNAGFAGVALCGAAWCGGVERATWNVDSTDNLVAGNFIGVDASGSTAIANGNLGVAVDGAKGTRVAGNVISGNTTEGVFVFNGSSGTVLDGNRIGVAASGNSAVPNLGNGITIDGSSQTTVGGETPAQGNVIAGNAGRGVSNQGADATTLQGNYIGLGADGSTPLPNGSGGVYSSGTSTQLLGNVISANEQGGASVWGNGGVVNGNTFGLDATGVSARSNVTTNLYIGGTSVSVAGNVLAPPIPAATDGEVTSLALAGGDGHVQQNLIGTDATGTQLPAGYVSDAGPVNGIAVWSDDNTIRENTIAFHSGRGVVVTNETVEDPATGNQILSNSIHSNGELGIDLGADAHGLRGVTANDPGDADTGSNGLQNFPVITGVDGTTIQATLNSLPDTAFYIQFFANSEVDPTGYGEGEELLAAGLVTTDASGMASIAFDAGVPLGGRIITATATRPATNDTSEFSAAFTVPAAATGVDLSLSAGVATTPPAASLVPIASIPPELLPPGGVPSTSVQDLQQEPSTVQDAPMSAIPMSAIPMSAIPMSAIPMSAIPLDPSTGGWEALLAGTVYEGVPLQTITLRDVLSLNPIPASIAALSIAQIDLGATPLRNTSLAAIALGGTPLSAIPLRGDVNTSLADWQAVLNGLGYSNVVVDESTTLVALDLAGVPMSAIPMSAIPMSAIDISAAPAAAIPMSAIDLAATPMSAIPMSAIDMSAVDLSATPMSAIPMSAIPMSAIGASAVPMSAIPMSAIPMSAIPMSAIAGIEALVDCTVVDCSTGTLGDAWTAGALLPGTTLETFIEAMPDLTLLDFIRYLGLLQIGDLDTIALQNLLLGDFASFGQGLVSLSTVASIPMSAIDVNATPMSAIPMSAIDLAGTPMSAITLNSIPMSAIDVNVSPLSAIRLDAIAGVESIVDCTAVDCASDRLGHAADAGAISVNATLGDLAGVLGDPDSGFELGDLLFYGGVMLGDLTGTPMSAIPMSAIPMSAIDIDATPMSAIALQPLVLESTPMSAIPMSAIPMSAIDADTSPLAGIYLVDVGISSTPMSAIPMSAIGDVNAVVDCTNTGVDCNAGTLGDAADAGAILPGATLGDLAGTDYGGAVLRDIVDVLGAFVLGDLNYYGDLTLADIAGPTLAEVLRGLVERIDYPWETLPLDVVDLGAIVNGPTVPYHVAFTISGGVGAKDAVVTVDLPQGFRYVAGSSTLNGAPIADAVGGGSLLHWELAGLDPDTPYQLQFQARPGLRLGAHTSMATIDVEGVQMRTAPSAPVQVTESFEPNDLLSDPLSVAANGVLVLSHISSADDVDLYRTPPGVPEGSRVEVFLSHLSEDADLLLFKSSVEPAISAAPLRAVPQPGTVIVDDGYDIGSASSLEPAVLQDVTLQSLPLADASARRADADERVVAASTADAGFTVAVRGYNGAFSPDPYVMRVKISAPPPTLSCAPPTFPFAGQGVAGTMPAVPADANVLFLVNMQRMGDLFGSGEATRIATAIQALLDANLGQVGAMVPVESDPTVAAAYGVWDANPCSAQAANGVVNAITGLIDDIRRDGAGDVRLPDLRHIVIVGPDEIIPQARIPDLTDYANERDYALTFLGSQHSYLGAMATGHVLSDNPYGDFDPIPLDDRLVFLPDVGLGRLVESSDDIVSALEMFVQYSGALDASTVMAAGYDFLLDGTEAAASSLEQHGWSSGVNRLINDVWTRADLEAALLEGPSLAAINAHYDHSRALPALGNSTQREDDLFLAARVLEQAELGSLQVARSVMFSAGCHSGTSVSDVQIGVSDPRAVDWAQAWSRAGALYAAQTGFGYGDTEFVLYTELLMQHFAERLDGALTVGQALAFAKHDYYGGLPIEEGWSPFWDKIIQEASLFGLPMYRIGSAVSLPPAPPARARVVDPTTGLEVVEISATPTFTTVTGGRGSVLRADALDGTGRLLALNYRPLQPALTFDVTQPDVRAHGAVITGLTTADQVAWDPVYSLPLIDLAGNEPEPAFAQAIFPTALQSIATYSAPDASGGGLERQRLVLPVAQFRADPALGQPTRTGVQRRFTSVDAQVFYSDSSDWTPPQILKSAGRKVGDQLAVVVRVADAADESGTPGHVARVLVLYRRAGEQVWQRLELSRSADPGVWHGVVPAGAGERFDYIVQAVDGAGNTALSADKGFNFLSVSSTAEPPVILDVTSSAVEPVAVGTTVELTATIDLSATVSGPGGSEIRASWNWGDGSTSAAALEGDVLHGSHTYGSAGVYTVSLAVTDQLGNGALGTYQYVVVFDPSAGFVTGGGWFDSPAGAFTENTSLTGKATFGFVSRYKRGATTPTGETRFQFQAAGLRFESTSYEWLVVSGARAQFKGVGVIAGRDGTFQFMLSAVDGDVTGGGGVDRFRIKIWSGNVGVVYDNQPGDPDDASASTQLSGGSITVHSK